MTDQLRLLPPFEWRGKKYPVTERNVSYAHETVQHKLQRRNQDLVEQTGAHNLVFTYTIPMREGLNKGPYVHLFTEGLAVLFADFRNKEPGELFDPIYGAITCVPSSYDDTSDNNKRDGTDIKLEFTQSPDSDDDIIATTPTGSAVADEASELVVSVQQVLVTDNVAADIPPDTSVKLTDLMSELSSTGRAILNTPNDILNEANKIVFWAAELEDIASDAVNPDIEAIRVRSRNLRDKANQVVVNAAQIRPTRTTIVEVARSVTSIAAEFGVSVAALLQANPSISRFPTVPVGSIIVIPDAAR